MCAGINGWEKSRASVVVIYLAGAVVICGVLRRESVGVYFCVFFGSKCLLCFFLRATVWFDTEYIRNPVN